MYTSPLVIEKTYNASIKKVWQALTEPGEMEKWYFDIPDFRPVIGHEFQYFGGAEDEKWNHLFKITDVIPEKKLSYSWRYENLPGLSEITFELFEEGDNTRLRLTHTGLESFLEIKDDRFARKSFTEGWEMILGTSLKAHLEK